MLSDTELRAVCGKLHEAVYDRHSAFKPSVFLCGGSAEGDLRPALQERLSHWYFDVHAAEDLFEDLLYGPGHQDLLDLENLVAQSVDAIVLVVESAGAIAELGAFASADDTRRKLICVLERKYRRKKSFINYGPLRLMLDKKEGRVIYTDFRKSDEVADSVARAIWKVDRPYRRATGIGRAEPGVNNVVQAHRFVLFAIYMLEPTSRQTIGRVVEYASGVDPRRAAALTSAAVSMLAKRGDVELNPDGYLLTRRGLEDAASLMRRSSRRYAVSWSAMDHVRTAILNSRLRGKPLRT